jgi:predicted double-glycine peptidase
MSFGQRDSPGRMQRKQMTETNILIAIPTHTGQIEYKCVLSLLELRENLIAAGIRYEIQFVAGSSLITNVRNYLIKATG